MPRMRQLTQGEGRTGTRRLDATKANAQEGRQSRWGLRGHSTNDPLIEAGHAVFHDKTYHATSVKEIAKRAVLGRASCKVRLSTESVAKLAPGVSKFDCRLLRVWVPVAWTVAAPARLITSAISSLSCAGNNLLLSPQTDPSGEGACQCKGSDWPVFRCCLISATRPHGPRALAAWGLVQAADRQAGWANQKGPSHGRAGPAAVDRCPWPASLGLGAPISDALRMG